MTMDGWHWAAWLADTKTGRIGPRIPALDGSKAEWELNGTGTWTIVADGDWLDTVPAGWWYPWASSVLICHDAHDGAGWQPVMLGPATEMPSAKMGTAGEKGMPATLTDKDIRAILARRIITGHRDWQAPEGTWQLQHEQVTFSGMSLGTIAERLITKACERYAGQLPIRPRAGHAQTGLAADDGHTRTYHAYNLSNNGADKRLSELSEVIGGPDLAMRPVLEGDDPDHPDTVTVEVWHGLEGQPQIPQTGRRIWDATAPRGGVTGLEVATDSSGIYTRSWATGAGEDADILMDVRQNEHLMQAGMPLMEQVQAYQSISNHGPLLAHVDADLAAASRPVVQWTVQVDASQPGCRPVTDWQVGDRVRLITPPTRATVRLTLDTAGLPQPPAAQDLTVTTIAASADLGEDVVKVKMQED